MDVTITYPDNKDSIIISFDIAKSYNSIVSIKCENNKFLYDFKTKTLKIINYIDNKSIILYCPNEYIAKQLIEYDLTFDDNIKNKEN